MRDFQTWSDEDLERYAGEQSDVLGLTFVVEERSPFDDPPEEPVWFAALKQMGVPLAPNGVGVLGAEAPTRRRALIGLAQLLDTLPDDERQRLSTRIKSSRLTDPHED